MFPQPQYYRFPDSLTHITIASAIQSNFCKPITSITNPTSQPLPSLRDEPERYRNSLPSRVIQPPGQSNHPIDPASRSRTPAR